jgi:hypothetical protein
MKLKTQIDQMYSLYKNYHCNHINLIINKISNYPAIQKCGI